MKLCGNRLTWETLVEWMKFVEGFLVRKGKGRPSICLVAREALSVAAGTYYVRERDGEREGDGEREIERDR